MIKQFSCRALVGLALAAAAASLARADSAGAALFKISPSARSNAMGMAQAVTAMGAEALSANPSNIGLGQQPYEAMSAYESLVGGAQYVHLAGALKLSHRDNLEGIGFSLTRLSVGGFQSADALGHRTGDSFGASDLALGMGASARFGPRLRAGVILKGLTSTIGSYSSGFSPALDAGALLRFSQATGALSIQNLGQGQKFQDARSPLPTTIRAGAGATFGLTLCALELAHQIPDSKTELNLGAERWIGPLALRGGYRLKMGGSSDLAGNFFSGLTGGIGVRLGRVRFDYALASAAADYGLAHRVSLLVQWGSAAVEDKKAPSPPRAPRQDASWYRENYWMW